MKSKIKRREVCGIATRWETDAKDGEEEAAMFFIGLTEGRFTEAEINDAVERFNNISVKDGIIRQLYEEVLYLKRENADLCEKLAAPAK